MRRALVTFLIALAVAAAPAAADDASVKRAWDSEDAAFTELGKSVAREMSRWQKRGHTRDSKLLRLLERGETLTRTVEQRVAAEPSSSPQGEEAKGWALKSLGSFARYFVAERRFVRAAPKKSANEIAVLARRLNRQSLAEAKRGVDIFKSLGIS